MTHKWHSLLRFALRVYHHYTHSHIPFFAAALSYYALFSLMPLLFLLVGVFGLVLSGNPELKNQFVTRLAELTLLLFPTQSDLATNLLNFLLSGAVSLTVVSFVILFWASSNFFAGLAYAMGVIFGSSATVRNRLAGLIAPFLIGLGLILISLLGISLGLLLRYLPERLYGFRGEVEQVVLFVGAVLLFFLTYRFLPSRSPKRWHAFLGALAAAVAWEGVRIGLPLLLPRSQYELFYGPLAGFLLALLGFYLSMWVLLGGAVIARTLSEPPIPEGYLWAGRIPDLPK
jgi:membrane protein